MTLVALLWFILPAVVLVAVLTAGVSRLSLRLAITSGLLAALGVAEIVNLVSGDSHGPAARSTFVAAAFTVLAIVASLGPAPALFTAAVVGVVVGALGLGAGAEVAPVAVATAVVTVAALAAVEGMDRRWTRRPPQLTTVVVFALLVGAIVAAIALLADRHLEGEPAVLAPGVVDPTIRPPQVLGDPSPRPAPTTANGASTGSSRDAPPPTSDSTVPVGTIWLAVSLVAVALLLLVSLRIIWVAIGWRLLRRRLRRGSGPDRLAGAWVWSTLRLRAAGWSMPPSLSVDVVGSGRAASGLPRSLRHPLRRVAESTTSAVYAPPGDQSYDPADAWSAADEVGRDAVRALSPARRLRFAVRSVNSRPSSSAALAPVTLEESRT